MAKISLKFSDDGSEFNISFGRKRSKPYASKEAGFNAVLELAKDEKITAGELTEMMNQIFSAKKLPLAESRKDRSTMVIGIIGSPFGNSFDDLLNGLLGNPFNDFLNDHPYGPEIILSAIETLKERKKEVLVPTLMVCKICRNHAIIKGKDFCSDELHSKKEAKDYLIRLAVDKNLSPVEYANVSMEIDKSTLKD